MINLLLPRNCRVYSYDHNEYWYVVDDTLYVGGNGICDCQYLENIIEKYNVTRLVILEGFTEIWDDGIRNPNLVEVQLPEGIIQINCSAFSDCTALRSIQLPKSLKIIQAKAFWCCTSLTSIVIPENVEVIEDEAFWGCKNLQYVEIQGKITRIAEETFDNCRSINTVILPASLMEIGHDAFGWCAENAYVRIPSHMLGKDLGGLEVSQNIEYYDVTHQGSENWICPYDETINTGAHCVICGMTRPELQTIDVRPGVDLYDLFHKNLERSQKAESDTHSIEVKKTVNPDGNYSECIIDHQTNNAEIHVYNSEGECVERVYGSVKPFQPVSKKELDEYITNLNRKYK